MEKHIQVDQHIIKELSVPTPVPKRWPTKASFLPAVWPSQPIHRRVSVEAIAVVHLTATCKEWPSHINKPHRQLTETSNRKTTIWLGTYYQGLGRDKRAYHQKVKWHNWIMECATSTLLWRKSTTHNITPQVQMMDIVNIRHAGENWE